MKLADLISILGYVIGAGSFVAGAGFPQAVDALLGAFGLPPGYGTKVAVVIGALAFMAAGIKRVLDNKTGAPATAITAGAMVVPSGTQVVHGDTAPVGINVTQSFDTKGP